MRKIYDKKKKLIEVQLEKGEQLLLIKENLKLLQSKSTVVPLKKK